MARPYKQMAKVVHMYAGLDLIGSKTTISSRDADLEVVAYGIKATSKKTKRIILIPYSNIKGAELLPNVSEEKEDSE